jgi:para-nitrobenzyl esterase
VKIANPFEAQCKEDLSGATEFGTSASTLNVNGLWIPNDPSAGRLFFERGWLKHNLFFVVEDGKAADEQAAYDWLLAGGDEVKEYLFALESDRLAPLMGNASIRMSVFPHLYADDVVIPADGFATTPYTSVPLLMLTGATEFSFFCLFDGWFSSDAVAGFSEDEVNKAKAFANTYGSDMYRIFNAQMSAEQMFDAYGSDIYIAQVDYGSANSAMASDLAPFGAFHGIFVPMLATKNNYAGMIEGAFDKAGYVAMAEKFNAYLKAFLATGDPNGEGDQWDPWTPDSKVSMVFDGDENDAIIELKDVTTTYDDIIAAMEADDSIPDDLKTGVINNVTNGRWFSDAQDEHFGTADLWLTGSEK